MQKSVSGYRMLWQSTDAVLRGGSQVMFQNNPLCGLFFFIAVCIAAYQAQMSYIAVACLAGTAISTLTAALSPRRQFALSQGLYGYNGCLTGAALATFLAPGIALWVAIVFWSALSVWVMEITARWLSPWRLPVLTAPFVIVSWIALLASYHFSSLAAMHLPAPAQPLVNTSLTALPPPDTLLKALLAGISQVFLANNALAGGFILLGLACASLRAMGYALLGATLALTFAELLGAEPLTLGEGLYAFSAVLTAIAIGDTFRPAGRIAVALSIAGIAGCVLLQGAFNTLLAPFGIPSLTLSFVLVTWGYLLTQPINAPTPDNTSPFTDLKETKAHE